MAEASGEDFSAAFEDLPGLEEMSNSEDDLCHTAGDNYVSIYKEGTMLENWTGKKSRRYYIGERNKSDPVENNRAKLSNLR